MARLTGAWKQRVRVQAAPQKWGTGVNPIHAVATEGPNIMTGAKLIAPNFASGSSMDEVVPLDITDQQWRDEWTPPEDSLEQMWGYSNDDGTSDRPRMDARPEDYRGGTELFRNGEFPAWNENGKAIRAQDHGSAVTRRSKATPTETVSEGWRNKVHAALPENSVDANPDQVFMNTSQVQRDKVRAGTQTPAGREDDHTAPIPSRVPGQRIKVYSGGERHYDMQPRHADVIVRPWWSRGAGTPPEEWMDANAQMQQNPRVRVVPSDPDTGSEVSLPSSDNGYGYTVEDVIPYA